VIPREGPDVVAGRHGSVAAKERTIDRIQVAPQVDDAVFRRVLELGVSKTRRTLSRRASRPRTHPATGADRFAGSNRSPLRMTSSLSRSARARFVTQFRARICYSTKGDAAMTREEIIPFASFQWMMRTIGDTRTRAMLD
jgi:hypothetical protein